MESNIIEHNLTVSSASGAIALRAQSSYLHVPQLHCTKGLTPSKPESLRDAGLAAMCGVAGMWLLLARVWLCKDLGLTVLK